MAIPVGAYIGGPDGLAPELKAGADFDPYALAPLLVDAGFTRQDPVDAHGEFCVRGGVIDIFPASLRIVSSVRTHFTTARCFSHWAFLPETRECTMLDGRKPGKD